MFALLLLLPSLLMADVMLTETAPVVTAIEAPANPQAPVATTPAVSMVATPSIQTNAPVSIPAADAVELRLQPSLSAPVVLSLSSSEISDPASTGPAVDGTEWFSTEREVTLEGFVEKSSIQKDLDITSSAQVWTTADKAALLTTVTNPANVRLLDADNGMGHIQIKEPRVLYFAKTSAVVAEPTPVVEPSTTVVEVARVSPVEPAAYSRPVASLSVATATRSIEGRLEQSSFLTGHAFYLVDQNNAKICSVAKDSAIDRLTMNKYLGKVVVLVGELTEKHNKLTLKVRSIRMR